MIYPAAELSCLFDQYPAFSNCSTIPSFQSTVPYVLLIIASAYQTEKLINQLITLWTIPPVYTTLTVIPVKRLQLTAFCKRLHITPLCNCAPATNNTNLQQYYNNNNNNNYRGTIPPLRANTNVMFTLYTTD